MSHELKAFYIALHQWLITSLYGSRRNQYNFTVVAGICGNLNRYCDSVGISNHIRKNLIQELHKSFKDAGLDGIHPFNNGSSANYLSERNKYNNSDRLKWIKNHI